MLRSFEDCAMIDEDGVGGRLLGSRLSKLAVLPDRISFWGATGGGEGGSMGAIERRPAIKDTRC